jgi:hypothetical protein
MAGIRLIKKYPRERAAGAYARMMSGEAQYRVVLTVVDDGIKGSPLLARQAAQLIHLENDKVVSELRGEPELRSAEARPGAMPASR